MDLTSTLQHGAPGRMPPGWGEKVVNPLVVLITMLIVKNTNMLQVFKTLLPRGILTVWMHPRGTNKRLSYLLHPEDKESQRLKEGQQIFLPRLILPIIDAVLRHTIPLFRGPGIDGVKILLSLRIQAMTELGM
jgi:hypothetical protein